MASDTTEMPASWRRDSRRDYDEILARSAFDAILIELIRNWHNVNPEEPQTVEDVATAMAEMCFALMDARDEVIAAIVGKKQFCRTEAKGEA